MEAYHIVQEGEAWVWRLYNGDTPVAQGILYAALDNVERDLKVVCEGDAPPSVFAVAPDKWAWAFQREGQRLGTTLRAFPTRDEAFDACIRALAIGRRAARAPWRWPDVPAGGVAEPGSLVPRGPSSSRASR